MSHMCWEINYRLHHHKIRMLHTCTGSRVLSTVTVCGKCNRALTVAEFLAGAMTQMLQKRSRGNKRVCHNRMLTCLHK